MHQARDDGGNGGAAFNWRVVLVLLVLWGVVSPFAFKGCDSQDVRYAQLCADVSAAQRDIAKHQVWIDTLTQRFDRLETKLDRIDSKLDREGGR